MSSSAPSAAWSKPQSFFDDLGDEASTGGEDVPNKQNRKINTGARADQQWYDPQQRKDVTVHFVGKDPVTGKTLYQIEGAGGDTDIAQLGDDHAAQVEEASEYGATGPDIYFSFATMNDQDLYNRAMAYAKTKWKGGDLEEKALGARMRKAFNAINFTPFQNNVLDFVDRPGLVRSNGDEVTISRMGDGAFVITIAGRKYETKDNVEASYILNSAQVGMNTGVVAPPKDAGDEALGDGLKAQGAEMIKSLEPNIVQQITSQMRSMASNYTEDKSGQGLDFRIQLLVMAGAKSIGLDTRRMSRSDINQLGNIARTSIEAEEKQAAAAADMQKLKEQLAGMKKIQEELAETRKRLEEIERQPMPGGPALRQVSKANQAQATKPMSQEAANVLAAIDVQELQRMANTEPNPMLRQQYIRQLLEVQGVK